MRLEAVLRALADGEYHSGEALARELGVTRAAVWKQVRGLERWGLEVEASRPHGYRLAQPIDLIDATALRGMLPSTCRIERLDVFTELDSTNRYLLEGPPPAPGRLCACIAEYQSAGRGRRGRSWRAPLGGGLCLSVAWQFTETPPDLPALTLAAGVVVRRVLAGCGLTIDLKWPNDLVWRERKLGGLLAELVGESQGRCHVVLGVGINVAMPRRWLREVSDWRAGAVDLREAFDGPPPSRTVLAGRLIGDLCALLAGYATEGFAAYRRDWEGADLLKGREVEVEHTDGAMRGRALGIDHDGALLIELAGGERRRVLSGEVKVRGIS